MYASIDNVVDKLERQIRKYKTRMSKTMRQRGVRVLAEKLASSDADRHIEDSPRLVKTKRFTLKPMSVEEAILQMDLLGHNFFVFNDADSEAVNVVYKRNDGNYGLIEPE